MLNCDSMNFGAKTVKPLMRRPSQAPAKLSAMKVGLARSKRRDAEMSLKPRPKLGFDAAMSVPPYASET